MEQPRIEIVEDLKLLGQRGECLLQIIKLKIFLRALCHEKRKSKTVLAWKCIQ